VENPEVFRSLNERIAALHRAGLEIVCECGLETCTERVVITHVEFYEVRRHLGWYVVRPGHSLADVDRLIVEQPSFLVVEKETRAA
jgi:hypothetical protein